MGLDRIESSDMIGTDRSYDGNELLAITSVILCDHNLYMYIFFSNMAPYFLRFFGLDLKKKRFRPTTDIHVTASRRGTTL